MSIKLDNTTVICPKNDGESYTIANIALSYGYDLRISKQKTWFCPLEKEPEKTLSNLKKNVIIIEMPSLKKEKELKALGHNLYIIDHHDYPSCGLNRDNELSSLEQFSRLINHTLSLKEKAIAINDQLYIYGLFKNHYSVKEINRIRKFDLKCQGYKTKELNQAILDLNSEEKINNNTTMYYSNTPKFTYLVDLHIMKNNGKFSNVVIAGNTKDARGGYLFFSGSMLIINKLKLLGGYSKKSNENYGLWGGYEFGDEKVCFSKALLIIKNFSYA